MKKNSSEKFRSFYPLPVKLFEEDLATTASEIQILRTGSWDHPIFGRFEINKSDLIKFKENFDNNVKRVDIAVDTEHFSERGAAGWIKGLSLKSDQELWASVEWTKWGVEAVKGKIFQYISPEFDFLFVDAETGKKFKNVLHAVTLTNRPFLKDMAPVVLSENLSKDKFANFIMDKTKRGGVVEMELKDLVALVGLKEGATEQEFKDKCKALSDSVVKLTEDVKSMKTGTTAFVEIAKSLGLKEDATTEDVTKTLNENLEKLKKLSKGKEGMVTLTEVELKELKANSQKGVDALKKLSENEASDKVAAAMRAGKITPKSKEWATEYALNDPEGFKKFIEHAPVVVKLKTQGSDEEGNLDLSDDADRSKLDARAKIIMSEKKCGYKEALGFAQAEVNKE